MSRLKSLAGLAFVSSLAVGAMGCPNREVAEILPTQNREEYKDIPVEVNRDVDILFQIDNSGSMGDEQTSLTNNFGRFIQVLENTEGGLPNVHLGVISTNVGTAGYSISGCGGSGDNGRLLNQGRVLGCAPPNGIYISDVQTPGTLERTKNYSGTLAETFACIAKLGTDGCGFEQHFESLKRALDGSNMQNQGFLRDNAFLAVIFLSDEDDCSVTADGGVMFDPAQMDVTDPLGPLSSFRCTEFGVTCGGQTLPRAPFDSGSTDCEPRSDSPYMPHPDRYVEFLKGLKTDPLQIIAAGIIGNPSPVRVELDEGGKPDLSPSCTTGAGKAAPGVRLHYFLNQFPMRNSFTSICNENLEDAVTQVAQLLARIVGNPCLEGAVDTTDLDEAAPGLQIDCSVADIRYPNTSRQASTPLRRCDMAADGMIPSAGQELPCWYVNSDLDTCDKPGQNGLIMSVERGSDPLPGTHVIARCNIATQE